MHFEDLLICPDCGSPDITTDSCSSCDKTFGKEDGTPRLISDKEIRFTLRHVDLSEVLQVLETALRMPRPGAVSGVYHLDPAHYQAFHDLPKGSTVLEIGCGGAQMRGFIEGLGHDYVGVDISKTRVTEDLRLFGGPDILCDAHNLPFGNGSFDVVYSAAVTSYMTSPQLFAQEVHRVLKPGGHYFSNCAFLEPSQDFSCFQMTAYGAVAHLAQAGFEIESMWPSRGYSGYQSLLQMGPRTARSVRWLGPLMRSFVWSIFPAKRILRGPERYNETAMALDYASTAGAIDWIAVKPA